MSTATEVDELEALLLHGDPKSLHYVCIVCWPRSTPPGVAIALCGYRTTGHQQDSFNGGHACADCLALNAKESLPCGHR